MHQGVVSRLWKINASVVSQAFEGAVVIVGRYFRGEGEQMKLLQQAKCGASERVDLSCRKELAVEELNVSRGLTLTATKIEVDFVNTIGV